MARPSVNIAASNGNLNLKAPSEFGTAAILVASPIAPVAGYGVAFEVRNIAQVKAAFIQAGNEAVVTAIVSGFYAEAPEGTKLTLFAMAPASTYVQMFLPINVEKALTLGLGNIRLVAAIKFPSNGYVPVVTNGIDQDVIDGVISAQIVANAWFAKKKPFRFLIEGFAFVNAGALKDYEPENKRNGAIVIGSVDNSTALATCLALGRLSGIDAQQNIGRIKSGSLKIAETAVVKLGGVIVDQVSDSDLELLWSKRYIAIEKNQASSGYVFSDDNALTSVTDDYNNLRYGRVIDNATRVAFATYYKELKDDVDVTEGGRLNAVVEKALEIAIETSIDLNLRSQFSKKADGSADIKCLVNPDINQYAGLYAANNIVAPNFNIIQTGQVYLFLQMRPKGCLKNINVYLGFVA